MGQQSFYWEESHRISHKSAIEAKRDIDGTLTVRAETIQPLNITGVSLASPSFR